MKLAIASTRRPKALSLLVAGGILFAIGIGGSGLLVPSGIAPQSGLQHGVWAA